MTNTPDVDLGARPRLADMKRLPPDAAPLLGELESASLEAPSRRRPPGFFNDPPRRGYDEAHLPFPVPLPGTAAVADDVLPIPASANRLDYMHFSVVMSKARKLPLFTAVNIEGARSVSIVREGGDSWFYDPRIPEDAQVGGDLYAGNRLDRGHLVRREDPNWGDAAEADVANFDTFHFTNCAPQMDAFNQRVWLGLESYILKNARAWRERCTVFTGPVFKPADRLYRGVQIPEAFWKVLAFVSDDGRPSATAYIIEQDKELTGLEAAFGAYETYQRSVRAIEGLSGLDFGRLRDFDGFSNEEAVTATTIVAALTTPADARV